MFISLLFLCFILKQKWKLPLQWNHAFGHKDSLKTTREDTLLMKIVYKSRRVAVNRVLGVPTFLSPIFLFLDYIQHAGL